MKDKLDKTVCFCYFVSWPHGWAC